MSQDEAPSNRLRFWWEDVYGVFRLSLTMLRKLRKNRHKAHWFTYREFDFYLERLREECTEIEITHGDEYLPGPRWVMEEAADAANFAMMIHERARRGAVERKSNDDK